jgi:hypothetical protein
MDWQGLPARRPYAVDFDFTQKPGLRGLTITLEGVRQHGAVAGAGVTRAAASSLAREGRVAYRVTSVQGPNPTAGRGEKRTSERQRSRLRSAKLLDSHNRFLCECLVHDRSSVGLCLKLMKNIGLPGRCRLFDDETGALRSIVTVWRRETVVGVRYCAGETMVDIRRETRAALQGRYYAIAD